MPGFPYADHDPADDQMPEEDACACGACRDPRPAMERLKGAMQRLLEQRPADDWIRQNVETRMATVKALRYRPILWRTGTKD